MTRSKTNSWSPVQVAAAAALVNAIETVAKTVSVTVGKTVIEEDGRGFPRFKVPVEVKGDPLPGVLPEQLGEPESYRFHKADILMEKRRLWWDWWNLFGTDNVWRPAERIQWWQTTTSQL